LHQLNELAMECYWTQIRHGFRNTPVEDMALIASEVSEALEDIREGKPLHELTTKLGKPEGVPSEMADVIIRVLGFCAQHGIDIAAAVELKMAYNETRPYKHGKAL
jgi:NTP pyrophosphatase (non-canonical NTP hydrolase)